MNEKIGVIIDFLTPAYEKTLRDTAARCGYDIVFFPSSKAAEGNVDDCTILYGHPSQRVIAGARDLKWYASCWAGVDRFCRDDLYQNPDCLLTNASAPPQEWFGEKRGSSPAMWAATAFSTVLMPAA